MAWLWLGDPYKQAEHAELCRRQRGRELNVFMVWTMDDQLTGEQYCWKGSAISLIGCPDSILVEELIGLQEFSLCSVRVPANRFSCLCQWVRS